MKSSHAERNNFIRVGILRRRLCPRVLLGRKKADVYIERKYGVVTARHYSEISRKYKLNSPTRAAGDYSNYASSYTT